MRLIDADAAIAECNKDGAYGYISAAELMELPTIDLVRCKDCLYYKNGHVCLEMSRFGTIETKPMDYCSYGERRADDDC